MDLYIGLGSNLGHREANIHRAINLLSSLIGPLVRASTLIETDPVDMDSDHKFLNAVAIFETRMHPTEIIRKTQMLEKSLGREVKSQNGVHFDRTIDIDILQYGDLQINVPGLTIPHPHMLTRAFVLGPLAEVAPDVESVLQPGYTFAQLHRTLLARNRSPIVVESDQDPFELEEVTTVSPDEFEQVNELLGQLTARSLSAEAYVSLITSANVHLYAVRSLRTPNREIVGMCTLCVGCCPSGVKGWIEDVVVDSRHRGLGLGKRLLLFVHQCAKELGVDSLILTSAPHRVEANGLYRSLGYEQRNTNAYRLKL